MKKEEIGREDILYLAQLSGLTFDDKGLDTMAREVEGVLNMLSGCAEVDGDEIKPARVCELSSLRSDEPRQSMDLNDVFKDKNCEQSMFVVPKVAE